MKIYNVPHFIVKNDLQKSDQTNIHFGDYVTVDVLRDVCKRITGQIQFTYEYVSKSYEDEFLQATYNKGRLAIMEYQNTVSYISFSEQGISGRNSSVQSVPTAYNMFYSNPYPNKRLYYYFLNIQGNAETDYLVLMYRLMHTIGFEFLNATAILAQAIIPFVSIEDIMYSRRINSGRNQSNNSTFITKSSAQKFDIYGKTYGANKYETSMICYALSKLVPLGYAITLYEMLENDLKELPASCLDVINNMGKIEIIPTDMRLEKKAFEENNNLRSPRYIYNLLNRLGHKRCALCGCEIPELVQGAHIWNVADIKKEHLLSEDDKLTCAIDGENGLWLCENHHKLFDENLLTISDNGKILMRANMSVQNISFIDTITSIKELPDYIITDKFLEYLFKRNRLLAI